MLKAVIFDMDGVIIDSEPMHARAAILCLKKYNVDITIEYLDQFIGSTTDHMCKKMIEDFNINVTPKELLAENINMKKLLLDAEGHIVIPYVTDLMKSLYKNGVALMIASSSPPDAIEEVMEALHIRQYFKGYVSGSMVSHPKPAPDIFLEAARRLQVKPEECIVIEDSTNGVNAAAAARMACIGFVNPNSGKQDLSKATLLVEGFDEVDFNFVHHVYQYAHMEPAIITTTERLIIRELTIDDIDQLYSFYQNPEVSKFADGFKGTLIEEKEKHKAYIQNVYHFYGFGLWGVFLKTTNQLIGQCGIELKIIDGKEEYEIGYIIDKSSQGFGYAMESATAVLDYAFSKLNVPKVIALIDQQNLKSIRLAENLGMVLNGEYIRNKRNCNKYMIIRNQ